MADKDKIKFKVKKKKASSGEPKPFEFLTEVNDYLEEVPTSMIESFDNYMDLMEKWSQDKVDVLCAWLAWKVNVKVEAARRKVLTALHSYYESLTNSPQAKAAKVTIEFVSDPIGTIGSWVNTLLKPAKQVIEWVLTLIEEIPRLAANLAAIAAALPPEPPSPHINFNKFRLKIGSFSLGEITKDPSSLPPIEDMFPEPEPPFNKKTFDDEFNQKPKEKKIKFNKVFSKKLKDAVEDVSDTSSN